MKFSATPNDVVSKLDHARETSLFETLLDSPSTDLIDKHLDRRVFYLDEEAFDRFIAILDDPPAPNEALRRLLSTPAPWDN